ncbi:hypothetical protein SRABI106_04784 [Rahnella aquatilis]|nr:hypothetical protein SRABI106_04784 [Rahnella aquatilis]
MVTDIDHVDVLIRPAQEQIEQDIETFGHVFGCLIHRTRDIHQTEHHRLARRLGATFIVTVAQIKGIDERRFGDFCPQLSNLFTQPFFFQ